MKLTKEPLPSLPRCAVALLAATSGMATRLRHRPPSDVYVDTIEPKLEGAAADQLIRFYPGKKDICITTLHMPHDQIFANISVEAGYAYARQGDYKFYAFGGRLSGERYADSERGSLNTVDGGGLVWQKLTALDILLEQRYANGKVKCEWAMWMDADAMFTNYHLDLESIIKRFAYGSATASKKDVILSREDCNWPNKLNTGVFFVKNSLGGHGFLRDIDALYERYRRRPWREQSAIHEWAFNADYDKIARTPAHIVYEKVRASVGLAPQKEFNAFRWDEKANPQSCVWQLCDLVGHATGRNAQTRHDLMLEMNATSDAC